jgi:hypothetical protein
MAIGQQVAWRYAMNANIIFKWLRDPWYTPEADHGERSQPLMRNP